MSVLGEFLDSLDGLWSVKMQEETDDVIEVHRLTSLNDSGPRREVSLGPIRDNA